MVSFTAFSADYLSDNSTSQSIESIPLLKAVIRYNLFLNPTSDSVSVDGNEYSVFSFDHSYNGKTLKIGFWYDIEYA